ncbi:hypothetical protein [Acuticoccus sp.]|uniref:hypothetical protein n=1 Tax=Acuticoccus sp. TaxID=1904378 RepID=UPI003B51DE44
MALLLAGCGGALTGTKNAVGSLLSAGAGPDAPEPVQAEPEAPRCPTVRVQSETELLRRDDGTGTAAGLSWQASIAKTARECTAAGEGVAVRVGVAGRVVEGPSGASGSVSLPVRVAVREASGVTYDKTHAVAVALDAPSKGWAFVDEAVIVAEPRGAVIYVGFDDT